jgi:two-component system, NtrC family, nitrogen regulation sensor histidine kinase NtrY
VSLLSRLRHDQRILLLAATAGAPGSAVALIVIWRAEFGLSSRILFTLVLLGLWLGFAFATRAAVLRPLQTVANLLAALRQEDYTIEGRFGDRNDPLGLVLHELNELRRLLRERRLGALEATALLRTVIAEIDVVILAFDASGHLKLANRAAERLLGARAPRLMGSRAEEIGLEETLAGETPRTLDAAFPGAAGRWEVRRTEFRQGGEPHQLVVLSDLSRALREEERFAWQRLIRVLSHEINNSLAPIHSIAQTLLSALAKREAAAGAGQTAQHERAAGVAGPAGDRDPDLVEGITVIARRAEALRRFMTSYARLAQLPPPDRMPVAVDELVERVARLEHRQRVEVLPGPLALLDGDPDQLDQALINLVQNAVDAAAETGGGVRMGWTQRDGVVEIWVEDDGPGLPSSANLFVPFFTTKPSGSGIGLALSRQIAEAHGGSLVVENREDGRGCRARLVLPG